MPNTPVTWLDQFIANATTVNAQFDPDIIQLANGNLLVSWTTNDAGGAGSPNGHETFAQIFDPVGNPIGGEIRLNNASTSGDEQNADLAPLPNGGFVVVYHDLDNPASSPAGGSNIRLEEYDANGAGVAENALAVIDNGSGADPNYRNPRVAVSSATSALIVYEEFTATGVKIAGKIYNPTTDTYGVQLTLINASGLVSAVPDVAVLSNGNYVIATTYRLGSDNGINYTVITNAGGGVKGPTFIPTTSSNALNDREASVTALAGGGFVIAWTNTDANDTDVLFRVYNNAGTEIGQGSAGDNSATDNNNEPKVIALADGTFVIAWDNDATVGVNVQHFAAAGAALGVAFVVAVDNADNISGVGLGDGRFALVWDGSGSEIAMEILDTRDARNVPDVYTPDQWAVGVNASESFALGIGTENAAGGAGDDAITGNSGDNRIFGGDGDDSLTGAAGADALFGGAGNDRLAGNVGDDSLDGGGGIDTGDYTVKTHAVVVFLDGDNLATVTVNGVAEDTVRGIENVDGGTANDSLVGDGLSNVLNGNGGQDFLFSNGFNPDGSMKAGAGSDTLNGGAGDDGLFAGDGVDTLDGGSGSDGMVGGAGVDTLNGGTGNDFLFGGFFTPEGAIAPGSGVDTLNGGDGNDGLYGFDGVDTINGDAGDDYVEGGAGVDAIDGGSGNDFLLGQDGADTITGGAGFDYEYGGASADTFVFKADDSADWVLDFNAAQGDRLRLLDFGFASFAAVPLIDLSTPGNPAVQLTIVNGSSVDQLTVFGVTLAELNAVNVLVA